MSVAIRYFQVDARKERQGKKEEFLYLMKMFSFHLIYLTVFYKNFQLK